MRAPDKYRTPIKLQPLNSFSGIINENPLEELWSVVEKFSIKNYLYRFPYNKSGDDLDVILNYAHIRIRQATEFRKTINPRFVLTSPLVHYYSFLNLLRGFLALKHVFIPTGAHGLKFKRGEELIDCRAKIAKGTFSEYLAANSIEYSSGDDVSLLDVLSNTVEISHHVSDLGFQSFVIPLWVSIFMDGHLSVKFPTDIGHFENHSKNSISELRQHFPIQEGMTLSTEPKDDFRTNPMNASRFLEETLLTDLVRHTDNDGPDIWYFVNNNEFISRAAYYFIGVFILGSAARYNPELVHRLSLDQDDLVWLISRFLFASERFFPQLLLSELYDMSVFF